MMTFFFTTLRYVLLTLCLFFIPANQVQALDFARVYASYYVINCLINTAITIS